jgi:hypothetical protein
MNKHWRRKASLVLACAGAGAIAFGLALHAQTTSHSSSTWAISIILPPRLVAGQPATLAVLGVDGRLAPDVKVDLSDGQSLTTDSTGRAFFTAPASQGYILAKGSGASVAALIDSSAPPAATGAANTISLPAIISEHDTFWICGGNFRGDSDANHVTIGGQLALVLAASPACLSVLPGPYVQPGAQPLAIDAPGGHWTASATVVFLEFAPPDPPLRPGKKGRITVRVRGSAQKLALAVENRSPGILAFTHGDTEEVLTSGGDTNIASLPVETIRSGDYSFHARVLPPPRPEIAARYLAAAATLAPRNLQGDVNELAARLSRNSRAAKDVRAKLDEMIGKTIAGDFRTLLEAARVSL